MAKSMNPKGLTHISGPESGGNRGGLGPDSRVIPLRGFRLQRIPGTHHYTRSRPLNATLASQRSIIRRETNDSTSSRVTTASSVALSDFAGISQRKEVNQHDTV